VIISKARLDGMVDGVFSVAMTLLVFDLRLPEEFHPKSSTELIAAIYRLTPQIVAYVVTFFVLGMRWITLARMNDARESYDLRFVRWSLLHLFFIACMPFSTMVVGRYISVPAAVWLYAANTIVAALLVIRLLALAEPSRRPLLADDRLLPLIWLVAVAGLSAAMSLYNTTLAVLLYLLTALPPLVRRRRRPDL